MRSVFMYNAAAYARASKDDADSGTIENQIELIREYAKSNADVRIISIREDNGYSGIDFARPSFGALMKDIEAGIINCVIVKDLSRLGRNYIEVGELMEEVFPRYKVRLISVNDCYDSINPRSDADDIIIPFRNLINEQYLRDSSVKIRSGLNAKRRNGDFVAAFAPYGYKRDETCRHKLMVDKHAAEIVRDIFRWKIEGMSSQKIAQRLNEAGEPSPAEYKKRHTNYIAKFQTHIHTLWSAVAVRRILTNPVCIGVLVQGRQTTPSYKVKRRINKPENEWYVAENAHESIINKRDFEIVNRLLYTDTRTAPDKNVVYPLSGLLYCGDCGNNMIRTKSGGTCYYICASSRGKNKFCTSHCIQIKKLEDAVIEVVARQITLAINIGQSINSIRSIQDLQRGIVKLNAQIEDREREIKACEKYRRSLYEDCKSGLISEEDYNLFGRDYTTRIEELRAAVTRLRNEADLLSGNNETAMNWLEYFIKYRTFPAFTRQLSVSLIERVEVWSGKHIGIQFRNQDRLTEADNRFG